MISSILLSTAGIFCLALLLCFILFKLVYRRARNVDEDPYVGGEKLAEKDLIIPSETLFYTIKKVFSSFYNQIAERHTGDISAYALWILATLVLVLIILVGGVL